MPDHLQVIEANYDVVAVSPWLHIKHWLELFARKLDTLLLTSASAQPTQDIDTSSPETNQEGESRPPVVIPCLIPRLFVLWVAFSIIHVYYTECNPKNKKKQKKNGGEAWE